MSTAKSTEIKGLHAFVTGRVQGVSFRAYTQLEARKLNLTGWVRNLSDGRVETMAEGSQENLKLFIDFLNKGPSPAIVEDVTCTWIEAKSEFDTFRIRYF